MNIALVVPGGVDRSGRERVVPALLWTIERLARRHNVLVVALNQEPLPSAYPLLGAQVINLGQIPQQGAAQQIRRIQQLYTLLRRQPTPIDLLHANWIGQTGLMTSVVGRLLRIPTLLSIGGGEFANLPAIGYGGQLTWSSRLRMRWAVQWATALTVGSHYVQRQLPQTRHTPRWLPRGVNCALFAAPVERPLGPPWRLLQVASINRVKDPHTLLQAMALVVDQRPDTELDWIGEDTLQRDVQRTAATLGLTDRVHFHGFQPTDVVANFCRRAHLYVQSSLHEGQGVAVLEAAAAGVPTVGTAVGLAAELAPTAALAVPPGNATALAEGILTLLDDEPQRQRLGSAAQRWAGRYDADWTAVELERFYRQMIPR